MTSMDQSQVLSLMGFDGPDTLSPKHEVQAEIDRLTAIPEPHHPAVAKEIDRLTAMLETATEEGGYQARK